MRGLIALVTGAAGSMGKATVEKFLADGMKVVAFDNRVFAESSKFDETPFRTVHVSESAHDFSQIKINKQAIRPNDFKSLDEGFLEEEDPFLFDTFPKQQFARTKKNVPQSDFYDEKQINRKQLFVDDEKTQKPEPAKESTTVDNETYFAGQTAENCIEVNGDILSTDDVGKAMELAKDEWGQLRVVVNCAGLASSLMSYNKSTDTCLDMEIFKRVVNTNTKGTFNVIRLAAETMAKNDHLESFGRGVIINTSSSFINDKGGATYSTSCSGIDGMTLPISRDLASLAIRVVTIAPGLFLSDMFSNDPPQKVMRFLSKVSLFPNRLGQGEDYAHLASAIINNQMLNGVTIKLDAGFRFPF